MGKEKEPLQIDCAASKRRMPAEWEPHRATWLAWPHLESDFPSKLETVQWVFVEIVRHLSRSERVEILCADSQIAGKAREMLRQSHVCGDFRLIEAPYHRTWLRDSAPTAVYSGKSREWIAWEFNAWAKYDDFAVDQGIPQIVAHETGVPAIEAFRPDRPNARLVLEGGAIETDGCGTMLVTEQCLLSDVQARNPGLSSEGYEKAFAQYLGIEKTIWLAGSCEGDDTHGHIDDAARFVRPGVVVVSDESKLPDDRFSLKNLEILREARDARGSKLEVIPLPAPEPLYAMDAGEIVRLPASYANFFIGNSVVLVPTFNDPHDREALGILGELFSDRKVVGIHAVDMVLGFGTLHCSTQQEPAALA